MTDTCLRSDRCVAYDRRTRTAAEVDDRNPLCPGCLQVAQRDISRLAIDYADLHGHLYPSLGQWGDGQPGYTGEPAMPLRGDVEALQRAIWTTTTTWEEILRDHCGLSVNPHLTVATAVAVLEPRVEMLARIGPVDLNGPTVHDPPEDMTGAEAILAMMRLHQHARSVLGLTDDTRRLPGYCQNTKCLRPDLRQDNGSETVYCGVCAATMTRDDYEKIGNAFLRGAA